MNDEIGSRNVLRHYLLGILEDDVILSRLEMRLLTNDEFAEEVSAAEYGLIEEYLDGDMSMEDSSRFEQYFLAPPKRKRQLHLTQNLRKFSERATEPLPAKLSDILRAYFRSIAIGAALVATVLIVGLVWFGYLGGSGTPLEREYAELNKRDLSRGNESNEYSVVSLKLGSFRDATSAATQKGDSLTDAVLFRLELQSVATDGATFRAKISRGGASVFELDAVRVYQNPNGQELRVLVPKAVLQKGQHQIRIEGASGAEAGTYAFVIE